MSTTDVDLKPTAFIEINQSVFVDIMNPGDLSQVSLEAIAHSLSLQNRFSGHTRRGYSVAEHSVNCSYMVDVTGLDAEEARVLRLEALLHDDTEALLIDIPSPIKRLWPGYKPIEAAIKAPLAKKFGVPAAMSPAVAEVDARICITEKLALLSKVGLENPAWLPLTSRWTTYRYSWVPRFIDERFFNKNHEPTLYVHWFMWPGRAKRLFINRWKELAA